METKNNLKQFYLVFIVSARIVIFLAAAGLAAPVVAGFVYDSHGKKDPFAPPVMTTTESAKEIFLGVKLEGIIWDEKEPLAIINGKIVGLGSVVAGAKIVAIRQNEVVFAVNGEEASLKLIKKNEEEL